ncbi:unnamed protein product, partial [Musa hybrid cultivar]
AASTPRPHAQPTRCLGPVRSNTLQPKRCLGPSASCAASALPRPLGPMRSKQPASSC